MTAGRRPWVPAVAAFAILGLGAWAGSALVGAPDSTSTPTASTPTASTPSAAELTTASPTTAPPDSAAPTTTPPASRASAPSVNTTTVASVPAAPGGPVAEVVALVNAARAAAGCPAVTTDSRLAAAAQAHSADMAARNYFSHTTPEGVTFDVRITNAGYRWSNVAENIAAGQRDAAEVMAGWMESDGHRRNILDCDLRQLGVGLAYGAGNRPYWTQDFGSPR